MQEYHNYVDRGGVINDDDMTKTVVVEDGWASLRGASDISTVLGLPIRKAGFILDLPQFTTTNNIGGNTRCFSSIPVTFTG
jgi:hypothetical protein